MLTINIVSVVDSVPSHLRNLVLLLCLYILKFNQPSADIKTQHCFGCGCQIYIKNCIIYYFYSKYLFLFSWISPVAIADAFDTEQLLACMKNLKHGKVVDIPNYDFKIHRSVLPARKVCWTLFLDDCITWLSSPGLMIYNKLEFSPLIFLH